MSNAKKLNHPKAAAQKQLLHARPVAKSHIRVAMKRSWSDVAAPLRHVDRLGSAHQFMKRTTKPSL